ncbi:MAG: DUF4202 domain-containing protein [Deltaproteobacteria bacterium]|nr:DUF4202 domain-containing protein [Deltaproteobacteria bacterium]
MDERPHDILRFRHAIDRIDAANADDPRRVVDDRIGEEMARERLYSRRMSEALGRLDRDASVALRLAVRAQHIRRWTIGRDEYPMDRAGYLRWREALKRFHAETTAAILRDVGYDEETIARVSSLLKKERLRTDPETQTLEDAACLVFLEYEFAEFAPRHDEAKIVEIVRKTWGKMSERGHAAAREIVPRLDPALRALVERALCDI